MKGYIVVISSVVCGVVGAAVGYTVAKDIYLKRADEEIASMKELCDRKMKRSDELVEKAEAALKEALDSKDLYKRTLGKISAENYIRENGVPTMDKKAEKTDKEPASDEEEVD